jgi:hypothetical protein
MFDILIWIVIFLLEFGQIIFTKFKFYSILMGFFIIEMNSESSKIFGRLKILMFDSHIMNF